MKKTVENYFLQKSFVPFLDKQHERIPVLTVDNYNTLGQLIALRFLEWIAQNADGVVCLPTGQASQYFIKWLHYYIDNWKIERRYMLSETGIEVKKPPQFNRLRLVQMGEFFPILPVNERSYHYHIQKYYIDGFGFDPKKALLIDISAISELSGIHQTSTAIESLFPDGKIDLSLREKSPIDALGKAQKQVIKCLDTVCEDYELKIRQWGGIGFFLDTIGPDGHIAFNARGSSHLSYTRLTYMNYETMAAAAPDLGGIEIVRKKAVVTIGLATVTFNPDCTAIVFAAGEERAGLIAQAVQQPPHIDYPAGALQKLPNARIYITGGASTNLIERRIRTLIKTVKIPVKELDRLVIDGVVETGTKLKDLRQHAPDKKSRFWEVARNYSHQPVKALADATYNRLAGRIQHGLDLPKNQCFLHTGPHHDDIELAYFPLLHHLVRSPGNTNYFAYMTSGYTSVTNDFVHKLLDTLVDTIQSGELFKAVSKNDLCNPQFREIEIHGYLNAIARQHPASAALHSAMRIFRHLAEYLHTDSDYRIASFAEEHIAFLQKHDPGRLLPEPVKQIKSWIREWESELVWAHFGLNPDSIHHLRLKFYSENLFHNDIDPVKDVVPVVNLLNQVKPTIVTLALDPEGNGPDTHFKTLQALRAALLRYVGTSGQPGPRIWGYRNVWSQFHPADATMIVPVSLNSFAVLHNVFNTCFLSQRSASFPSTKLDGTFSELAQKTWVQQFNDLTALMGKGFFYNDPHPMMRRAYGIIYLNDMSCEEFFKQTEGIDLR
jgi:glucosamine-6-phosphate deaminase